MKPEEEARVGERKEEEEEEDLGEGGKAEGRAGPDPRGDRAEVGGEREREGEGGGER